MRPRLRSGACVRPLSFTVIRRARHDTQCPCQHRRGQSLTGYWFLL